MARFRRPPLWLLGLGVATVAAGAVVASQSLALRRWSNRPSDFDPDHFLFPGTEHVLRTPDGGSVFAIEAGTGPTVILGHGLVGDHTHWAPVAHRLLAEGFRVVIFDQRGHGKSTAGSEGLSLQGLANDVATVINELGGNDKVIIVGHSLGGVGVQSIARHRPEVLAKVDGAVLVATLGHTIAASVAKLLSSPLVLLAYRQVVKNPNRARLAARGGFGTEFSVPMLDQLARTWDQTPDSTLVGFGAALGSFNLLPDLERFNVPTVVICGTVDTVTPMKLSEEIHAALPDSRLVRVADAGHMIVWEAPGAIVKEIVALAGTAGQRAVVG
jgi:non-heme chloroperoxidase